MTAPNKEAVEVLARAMMRCNVDHCEIEDCVCRETARAALAAMPFLAPQPSGEPPFDTFGSVIDGMPDTAFVVAFYDEHANYLGDMGAKALRKLISPQPTQGDEELAALCDHMICVGALTRPTIAEAIATVRAEATIAGAADERERILSEIAEKSPEIAAAIRARKP